MPKRNLAWLLALVAVGLLTWHAARRMARPIAPGPRAPRGRLDGPAEVYELLRREHYPPPRPEALTRGTVRGMVEALGDEFSRYLAPGEAPDLADRLTGRQHGLGLRIDVVGGEARVIGPLAKSPAYYGGVRAGDVILSIDGQEAAARTAEEVDQLLRVPMGTSVALTIRRGEGTKAIALQSAEFDVETVQGLSRTRRGDWQYVVVEDRGICYLRVREFVPSTMEGLRLAYRNLRGDLRGLVLDLRGSPGGMLSAAVEAANMFLSHGLIVKVVGRGGRTETYEATPDGTVEEVPLVVLIDGGTASAAEIVAGALAAHGRAVLVGTRTCGKGCVQRMFDLPGDLGRVHLTTAEFVLAHDRRILRRAGSEVWGVEPVRKVLPAPGHAEALARLRAAAEVMPPPSPSTMPATGNGQPEGPGERILQLDVQLACAVELLAHPDWMKALARRAAEVARRSAGAARSRPAQADDERPDDHPRH